MRNIAICILLATNFFTGMFGFFCYNELRHAEHRLCMCVDRNTRLLEANWKLQDEKREGYQPSPNNN